MNFDDDFFEAMRAAYAHDDIYGAGPFEEVEEEARTEDGTVEPDGSTVYSFGGGVDGGAVPASPHAPSVSERPRRRGSRGGSTTSKRSTSKMSEKKNSASGNGDFKRWRSGQVPPAPVFEGDVELDPYCLSTKHEEYLRGVGRNLTGIEERLEIEHPEPDSEPHLEIDQDDLDADGMLGVESATDRFYRYMSTPMEECSDPELWIELNHWSESDSDDM